MADFLVMAKPGGPRCNLHCEYCYYLGKERLFPQSRVFRMSDALLERYIAQRFAGSSGPVTHFEWHGGEPTLLGLDYFRTIVRLQRKHRREGWTVSNGLQTNGILIDGAWADFLAEEAFSVGLSLDGPPDLHDCCRKSARGSPTQSAVVEAFRLLKARRVFCNVLCVLHAFNTPEPERVYDFFRDLGVSYIQFLPLTGKDRSSAPVGQIGAFLCRVFDRWIREDVGRIVVQLFDETLRPIYGVPHSLCIHRETCGDVVVLEHNGDLYACDHFVDSDHLIGNLQERTLQNLTRDPKMVRFGKEKQDALPRSCRECEVLSFCNGGCPKDRTAQTPDGEWGLNVLCPAYRQFFIHARPELRRLSGHIKAGKPLRAFRAIPD